MAKKRTVIGKYKVEETLSFMFLMKPQEEILLQTKDKDFSIKRTR